MDEVVDADLAGAARAAAAGDLAAFAVLVRATSPRVVRCCAALVDAGSAQDLAQETYLRAYQSLGSFRGEAGVLAWLLGIARHACADEVRRRTRQRRTQLAAAPRLAREPVDPAGEVDLALLVAGLPADRREAFVLTQVMELSYAEAAAICGCPVGTIRSRVARAREDLVAALAEPGRTLSA